MTGSVRDPRGKNLRMAGVLWSAQTWNFNVRTPCTLERVDWGKTCVRDKQIVGVSLHITSCNLMIDILQGANARFEGTPAQGEKVLITPNSSDAAGLPTGAVSHVRVSTVVSSIHLFRAAGRAYVCGKYGMLYVFSSPSPWPLCVCGADHNVRVVVGVKFSK